MAQPAPTEGEAISPPYIPWRTFLNLLDQMKEGVPSRLDSSWLSKQAGGMHQPIQSAFRFFNLTGPDNRPLPGLEDVAKADDRRDVVAALIRERYPWAFDLGENATHLELQEAFRGHGLTGSTQVKGIRFFLAAAGFAGIKVSPHFKLPREGGSQRAGAPRAAGSGAKRRGRPPKADTGSATPPHKQEKTGLHPVAGALVDALVKQLQDGGDTFDNAAFTQWVDAFKKAAPVWARAKAGP